MSKYFGTKWATKELPLPIDVIVAEYRQAKKPTQMIDILAEQCEVNPCRIAWILNRAGLEVEARKMPRALRGEDNFDYVAYWETSEDAQICDRLRRQREEITGEREAGIVEAREEFEKEEKIIERLEEAVKAQEREVTASDYRRDILTSAAICVCTDRNAAYGEPEDNFQVIAEMWSCYLRAVIRKAGGIRLDSEDVADMMVLFKVARNATAMERQRDTYVDIAGYAACGGAIAAEGKEV